MSQASELELLMLDLINEERTSRGLNPLEINSALNDTAEDHSQWMLQEDIFSHTGAGGSSAHDRIAASDYALEGNWGTAENIGWQSERGEAGIADDVAGIHESLMNSPGHRANILNPDLEHIGIGIERGDFTTDNGVFDGVMITQNFGRTDAAVETPDAVPVPLPVADSPELDVDTPVVEPEEPETTVIVTPIDDPVQLTDPPAVTPQPVMNTTPPIQTDAFDFVEMPVVDDVVPLSSLFQFTGVITTTEGTVTSNDVSEFESLLVDLWPDFGEVFSECWDFA